MALTASDTGGAISELLPKLMLAVGNIGKDRRNAHQNYQFRGIDDVLNHVGPPCAELGIRVSPTVHDYQSNVTDWVDEGRRKFQVHISLKLRLEFVAPDGSSHVAEAIGEAMDTNGDKATNKAMSAAFKYACFMGLVIPVDGALDDSDNDDKQPDRAASAGRSTSKAYPDTPQTQKGAPERQGTTGTGRWQDAVVPVGKNKGKRLGDLEPRSISWYVEKFEANPKYSDSVAFRKALDDYQADKELFPPAEEPHEQEVPF